MAMMEIFLEGKRLDISKSEAALLTFALDDIKNFSSREGTFSKTIVLPGTANNNKLFGNIYDVKVSNSYNASGDNVGTNFNPSVAAECLIFQSRLQVFKGTLRLLEVVVDQGAIEYEVAVFGELGSLVGDLGTNRLEDLDFSTYDHAWTIGNVTGSWENINGSGYFYPLIDYGGVSTDKVDYDIRALRPALFVREYIDKMLTNAGYTWESDLFNTSRFKSLIIPNNQKNLSSIGSRAFYSDADIAVGPGVYSEAAFDEAELGWQSPTTLGDFTGSLSNTRYTYNGTNQLNANVRIVLTGEYISTASTLLFKLRKNGADHGTFVGEWSGNPGSYGTAGVFRLDGEFQGCSFNTNDYWEIVAVRQDDNLSYSFSIYGGYIEFRTQGADLVSINYGEDIDVNSTIPRNILQRDFLASIVKLFNLYVYEDRLYKKKLLIKPYVDFYDLNPSGVVDWTYKVDRSKPQRIKPMSELNSRYYEFKFKDDNDYYNELYRKLYNNAYGNYTYDSQYQFTDDRTSIELIFSPSVLVGYTGTDKIVPALYKQNNGIEEAFPTNIRIMQAKKITGVTSWIIKDANHHLVTLTSYGYGGHYDDPDAPANDIHFGVPSQLYFTLASGAINVTQFNVYWSPYMAEITDKDAKLLTCHVKLNSADVFGLDFSKLIYIDGSYWRLNKVVDWNATEPDTCVAEFIKVINLLY